MDKPDSKNNNNSATESFWRRENDIRSELEKTQDQLEHVTEHVLEIETKCDRALTAEKHYLEATHNLQELKETDCNEPELDCESLPAKCRKALVSRILEGNLLVSFFVL